MKRRFFKPADAGRILDVSVASIYRLIASGQLKAYKIGRGVRIPRRELLRFLREGKMGPPQANQRREQEKAKKRAQEESRRLLDKLL